MGSIRNQRKQPRVPRPHRCRPASAEKAVVTPLPLTMTEPFWSLLGLCPHLYLSDQVSPILTLWIIDKRGTFPSRTVTLEGAVVTFRETEGLLGMVTHPQRLPGDPWNPPEPQVCGDPPSFLSTSARSAGSS